MGLLLSAVVALSAGAVAARTHASPSVRITGTAYEFNRVHTMLAGATIRVAEVPKLKAVVRPDGRYELTVPDHAKITPYIVDAGYHTTYLQTFTTDGEDLVNVNFQTPNESVYRGLVALLGVPIDAHGNLKQCAIVSTFNTRNVRDLSYVQFIAYGAHGVAGATASTTPVLPKPVYFNASVIPDRTQKMSSQDGGVVWTGVPVACTRSLHTIRPRGSRASSPHAGPDGWSTRTRRGGCTSSHPGTLRESRLPWSVRGGSVAARSLSVSRLPAGAVVRTSCSGRGCPSGSRRTLMPAAAAQINLLRALGGSLKFAAGDRFSVAVSAHAFNGAVWRWTMVPGHAPKTAALCVTLGFEKAQRTCATG